MKSVLVTGSNGGIGSAICKALKQKGYLVIGTDRQKDNNNLDGFVQFDIRDLVLSETKREEFYMLVNTHIKSSSLFALINNAAVQLLAGLEELNIEDFKETIDTNLTAPLCLSKMFYSELKNNKG